MAEQQQRRRRGILLWGGSIGFGLGAVVDVLVFHMIFQTHHLLSGIYDPSSYDGFRTNVVVDGVFTLFMLGVTLIGLGMLWRLRNRADERYSTRYLIGAIIVGSGVFNLIDGVVSHYVLGLHSVVHGNEWWNPHWIGVSLALIVIGVAVLRLADGYRAP